jgi:hypothetical protein
MDPDLPFSLWYFLWFVFLLFGGTLWDRILHSLPRIESSIIRFFFFLSYPFCIFLALVCFALGLRTSPYSDFGFYFSIAIPSVTFWIALSLFVVGFVKTAFVILPISRKRFRIRSALRGFWPYTVAVLPMHLAFAAAYSCRIGRVVACAVVGEIWYQHYVIPEKKDKRPRAKWE